MIQFTGSTLWDFYKALSHIRESRGRNPSLGQWNQGYSSSFIFNCVSEFNDLMVLSSTLGLIAREKKRNIWFHLPFVSIFFDYSSPEQKEKWLSLLQRYFNNILILIWSFIFLTGNNRINFFPKDYLKPVSFSLVEMVRLWL